MKVWMSYNYRRHEDHRLVDCRSQVAVRLPDAAQDATETALDRYALDGYGDVKPLVGRDSYRLRVGRYRIVFDEDRTTILAIYIGERETTTYKRKGRK